MPVFLKRTIWRWMFAIPAAIYMVLAVTGQPAWVPVEAPYYLFIPFVLGLTVLAWGALKPTWRFMRPLPEETPAEKAYYAHRAEAKALAVTARRTSAPPIRDNVERDALGFPIKDDDDDDEEDDVDDRPARAVRDYRDGPRQGPVGYVLRVIMTPAFVGIWLVCIEALVQAAKWARERGLWYVSAPGFILIAFLIWYLLLRPKKGPVEAAAASPIVQGGADDLVR